MRPATAPKPLRPRRTHIRDPNFPRDVRRQASSLLDGSPASSIPQDTVKPVMHCLRAYRDSVIAEGDYMHAQEVEDKINDLMLRREKQKYEDSQLETYQELTRRLERARSDLQAAEEACRIYTEDVNRRCAEEREELAQMQRDELRELESQFAGDPPYKFVRWSPGYLNLRRKEKFLVKSRRYVEAHDMKLQADKVEREDVRASRGAWKAYGTQQKELLLRQHQVKMEYLLERYEQERVAKMLTLNAEVERCANVVRLYESRVRDAESYNSPGARNKEGKFTRIAEGGLGARLSLVRTSNYKMKMERRKEKAAVRSSRPQTAK